MHRLAVLLYGTLVYALFLVTLLYAVGFVTGLAVPKAIDDGAVGPSVLAVAVNVLLLSIFAIQHTIMARPAFKLWWTRIIPPAAERSTFVLLTCAALGLIFWQWKPLPDVVWSIGSPVLATSLWIVCGAGWATVLVSTFLIDHFDLFGLRQVILHARGKPYTAPVFRETLFYRHVRHPLLLGFMVAFWATPHMTLGHLLFAAVTTGYMLVGIQFEERDLARAHGQAYGDYRRRVPMLLPLARAFARREGLS